MAKHITDDNLLQMLLIHGGVSGTAAVTGLSRNAIYKRLQNPELRNRYDQMQGVVLTVAAGSMSDAVGNAVKALRDILDDPETSAGVRVSAADALLRHCARYVEVANVLRRLEALENAQKQETMKWREEIF